MRHHISMLLAIGRVALTAPTNPSETIESEIRPDTIAARATFPFNKVIAFGDDFTDNGAGSYAHGITGNTTTGEGKALWGANTWTDGPVSATFLAQSLGVPLTYDYAFGSAGGGAVVGSVCNNSLIPSNQVNSHATLLNGNLVPDALGQISNYTATGKFTNGIGQTLHFVWTGNNDMIASLGWIGRFTICNKDTLCHPGQNTFITQVTGCINTSILRLLRAGAQHIIVPNVYPRNLAPWTSQYISSDPGMIADFGGVITRFNAQLRTNIQALQKQYPSAKIIYYDANAFLTKALSNPSLIQGASYNYTCVDGCYKQIPGGTSNWNLWFNTVPINHKPSPFYWMTTVMPSSTVLRALATDMQRVVKNRYGVS